MCASEEEQSGAVRTRGVTALSVKLARYGNKESCVYLYQSHQNQRTTSSYPLGTGAVIEEAQVVSQSQNPQRITIGCAASNQCHLRQTP